MSELDRNELLNLSAAVEEVGKELAEAERRMTAFMRALKAEGVTEDQIQRAFAKVASEIESANAGRWWAGKDLGEPLASLHDRMSAICDADAAFLAVWDRLSDQGACDARGGAEQRRVKDEWYAAGKPDLEPFIRERANAVPESCSQCGAVFLGHHACEGVPGGFSDDEEAGPR